MAALSGAPGLFCGRRSAVGQVLSVVMAVPSGLFGLIGAWGAFRGEGWEIVRVPLPIPGAEFALGADSLSAFFLAPVFLISAVGSVYGLEYWKQADHPDNGRRLRFFYGILSTALAVVVLARNSVTFLIGWETMAVSAFFLVGTDDTQDDVRDAGWLYLGASHAATLSLFALFGLLYSVSGSFEFTRLDAAALSPGMLTAVFLLALFGFGLKAGLMPLHFWLPSAHAMAPSHVSAIMSGVLIKSGVYGLLRITWMFPNSPLWWGGLILALGVVSAVLGIVFAASQNDLKRLLAYSSIDNMGVVAVGLGLALLGRSLNQPAWMVLGLGGALFHVWNHAIFKSLLFFAAGAVIHTRGTRRIDLLGGLAGAMPWTAAAFLIGATAACGLPPLNGFVSEFLIYFGLFQTLGLGNGASLPAATFAIPALALMGAGAVVCFTKAYGIVFLGTPRQHHDEPPHSTGPAMRTPFFTLGALCLLLGAFPGLIVPAIDRVLALWGGPADALQSLASAAPVDALSYSAIALFAALGLGLYALNWKVDAGPLARASTWGCGYTGATPRIQYTGTSLVQILEVLFRWSLLPVEERPKIRELFPQTARFETRVPEIVLDRALLPAFRIAGRGLVWVRLIQQGSIHIYLLYILAALVLLLVI